MEVVLLWLDDLEDLILVVALILEKWRIALLEIGLLAALGVQGSMLFPSLPLPAAALAGVASTCVAVWSFGFLAWQAEAGDRRKVSLPA